ncbi:hypothetical protein [Bradyrhizobium sp. SBR1B]|uniref:hypothetical protein n=1 Tax=Bradyrhizobium sp. SBR1B TaxID=2663836 RepID=UPI00181EA920|nr:hypothetical protein [Bradyrhizobium sp. SBR1B]MBB4376378.1 hypothetical protein [Bradyrhizobium sp. SBR1B]
MIDPKADAGRKAMRLAEPFGSFRQLARESDSSGDLRRSVSGWRRDDGVEPGAVVIDPVAVIVIHDGVPDAIVHVEESQEPAMRALRFGAALSDKTVEVQQLAVEVNTLHEKGLADRKMTDQAALPDRCLRPRGIERDVAVYVRHGLQMFPDSRLSPVRIPRHRRPPQNE